MGNETKKEKLLAEEKRSLEDRINESPLFSIDKEADPVTYDKEKYKLLCLIGEYINKFYARKYADYGLEVTLSYGSCIKAYNKEKGQFLAYYMTALSNKCRMTDATENANDEGSGVHLTTSQKRIIVAIRKLLEAKGLVDDDINDEVVDYLAKRLGLDSAKMKKAIMLYQTHRSVRMFTVVGEDEVNVIDKYGETEESTESFVLSKINCYEILDVIEDMYLNEIQFRQREVISPCMTALIAPSIVKNSLNISSYEFVDKTIMCEYLQEHKLPLRKEIADSLGKNEASISRTIGNFLKDLRERLSANSCQ